MKEKRRNIELAFTPEVAVSGTAIMVSSGSWRAGTKYECKGSMSIHCAGRLVRELRKAMRQIRREQAAMMDAAIHNAEQVME